MRVTLAYILLCLIWGSTWLAIRVAVEDVPPIYAAGIRFVIASLALAPFAAFRRRHIPTNRQDWRTMILLGLTMVTIPYALVFWAEQYVSSSMTAVLYSSAPLATAVLTPLVLAQTVPRRAVLALLIATGGVAYLFNADLRGDARTLLGGAMVLASVTSSAFANVVAKKRAQHIDPVISCTVQFVIGAVVLLVMSVIEHQPAHWTNRAILAIVFLATFGSAVGFATYYWMLKHMAAYKAATVTLVVPFIAILEGSFLLQERITLNMLVSAIVVLGAVAVVLKAQSDEATSLRLAEAGEAERPAS